MVFLVILFASIAISMALIPLMVRVAPRLGLIDRPSMRKVHALPVSRVGGIGIALGALVPIAVWVQLDPVIQAYLFGSLVLLCFGVWDDSHELGHYVKFIGQFIAVLAVVLYGDLYVTRFPLMGPDLLAPSYAIPFTVFAMVGMINAINHSDGLDGLAGGESLLSFVIIAFLAFLADGFIVVAIAVAAIGGVLGFLRFNTHPAKVFMGDSGSQFLGFTLAFLAVLLTQKVNPALSPALPLLFLGLPIIDILVVLALRAYHGMNWFRASRNHIHHRLLDLGFVHGEAVIMIYGVQAAFVVSAIFLSYAADMLVLAMYLVGCSAVFFLLTLAERTGWKVSRHGREARLPKLIESVTRHPLFCSGPARVLSVGIPVYFLAGSLGVTAVPRDFGVASAVLCVLLLMELLFGRGVSSIMQRVVAYSVAVFVVFLGVQYPPASPAIMNPVDILYFSILALAIGLTVRYTRDINFRTTPTDYLVILVVLAIGAFPDSRFGELELGAVVVKAVIAIYGCEVLANRTTGRWSGLNISCLAALAVMGVRGIL